MGPDSAGAGASSPATPNIPAANNQAVYEILYTDTASLEFVDVPFTVLNGGPGAAVQVTVGFAPLYSGPEAGQPSSSLPVPRFIDRPAPAPCSSGFCLTAFPN